MKNISCVRNISNLTEIVAAQTPTEVKLAIARSENLGFNGSHVNNAVQKPFSPNERF